MWLKDEAVHKEVSKIKREAELNYHLNSRRRGNCYFEVTVFGGRVITKFELRSVLSMPTLKNSSFG